MKNTFGQSVSVTIYGESHGQAIGVVLDGLAPGISVDEDFIQSQLTLRRPSGSISTARQEPDPFQILSGVYEGKTTGTPISIMIPNSQTRSKDYSATRSLARPGHADYTAYCKYHGFEDFRGGGHFSGRITAGLVAGGAIALSALKAKNILIGTHIKSCGNITDRDFQNLEEDIQALNQKTFAVLDEAKASEMHQKIVQTAEQKDSIGGILETAVLNLPAGIGEPWFDTVEGLLSHALFSIPAVKGVQFGNAFDMVNGFGSEYNDNFRMQNNSVITETNHNAGINGGITNGMPIYQAQNTVDFFKNENAVLEIKGRHDPAIIHRARVVVDSITALVLCDILAGRYGTDWLA